MVFLKQALISSLKSYFPVRKHQIELENTWRFTPTAIIYIGQPFVRQCPPWWRAILKNGTDYIFDLETINVVQSLCLMSLWVQRSKSQYLEAFVFILWPYFILIFIQKKMPYQGGTPRLIKSLLSSHPIMVDSFEVSEP